jgi:hypothetical protein
VFTVDFSGHGRSSGVIPTGEHSDFLLAHQVNRAKTKFKSLARLSDDDIFLLGHSMGSRAIMKASQIESSVKGYILIGSAINVDNISNDSWVNDLGPDTPDSNILILTGAWDDVQPPQEALRLFQKLTGNDTLTELRARYLTPNNNTIEIFVFNALTHTHESMSVGVSYISSRWAQEIYYEPPVDTIGLPLPYKLTIFDIYPWICGLEVIGFFLLLIFGFKTIKFEQERRSEIRDNNDQSTDLFNLKKFYWFKLLIWLGAFVIAVVVGIILLFMPISIPYFTLIFFCPLVGYGAINMLLYGIGKMPGYNNKWKPDTKNFFKTIHCLCFLLL